MLGRQPDSGLYIGDVPWADDTSGRRRGAILMVPQIADHPVVMAAARQGVGVGENAVRPEGLDQGGDDGDALAGMVDDGEIDNAQALRLARMALRENAIQLYKLQ